MIIALDQNLLKTVCSWTAVLNWQPLLLNASSLCRSYSFNFILSGKRRIAWWPTSLPPKDSNCRHPTQQQLLQAPEKLKLCRKPRQTTNQVLTDINFSFSVHVYRIVEWPHLSSCQNIARYSCERAIWENGLARYPALYFGGLILGHFRGHFSLFSACNMKVGHKF